MRWVLTPVGLEPFDAAAREFHASQTSGEPFIAQVIEIDSLIMGTQRIELRHGQRNRD